LRCGQY